MSSLKLHTKSRKRRPPTDAGHENSAPPPAPVAPARFYRPQLDALRFFAFLAVFLHHNLFFQEQHIARFGQLFAHLLSLLRDSLGYGLSLFFLLSAYLITSLMEIEKAKSGSVHLKQFYVRRVLRIWPLYFGFLGAIAVAGIWMPPMHLGVARVAAMSLLAGNWYSIYAGPGAGIVGHLWSISVEEQFYAVWPGLFKAFSRRNFLVAVALIGTGSILSTALLAHFGASSQNLWYSSFCEGIFFAAGAALALLLPRDLAPSFVRSAVLIASGIAFWIGAEMLGKLNNDRAVMHTFKASPAYLLAAAGCSLLLIGFLTFPASRVPRPLIYLGKISYGLYVYHALAMFMVPHLLGTALRRIPGSSLISIFLFTVIVAALSYEFFEKPFLKLKNRFELIHSRPI